MEVSQTPRQSQLTVLYAPDLKQTAYRVPRAAADLTSRFNAENLSWPGQGLEFREILSCDNQSLVAEVLTRMTGTLVLDFLATSRELGWIFALAYGSASSASSISANNAVWTLTITATGGTYQIEYDGRLTAPLAYSADAAAIDAAIEAVLGTGTITTGGTGPWTLTGAGSLASTDLAPFRLVTAGLTGGSATIVETTPGGPQRYSYTITLASSYQPPPISLIFAYSSLTTGYMASDVVLNSFTLTAEDTGLYRVVANFTHSGPLVEQTGLTIPACATPDTLETRRGKLLLGAVDATPDLAAAAYAFSNDLQIDDAYTLASPFSQRMERADRRTHGLNFEINQTHNDDVWDLCVANGLRGTEVDLAWRIGSGANGGTFSAAQSIIQFQDTQQQFAGPANRARIPVIAKATARTAASTRPASITVITTWADGYLATS